MINSSAAAFELSDVLDAAARDAAVVFDVAPAIHQNDHLFAYCLRQSPTLENCVNNYFSGGFHDAKKVKDLVDKIGLAPGAKVLEFAAGYGRVTRHLRRHMPELELLASDIHKEAGEFIGDQIGVPSIVSHTDPEKFRSPESFDLIFVLSLFSHLPERTFGAWIQALASSLKPGGFLMFTTHGEFAASLHKGLADPVDPLTGFGFLPQSEQEDLSVEDYGTSIVFPHYVIAKCRNLGLRLHLFESGTWFGLQDGWVFKVAE
jgi:SAM-dependent methyltransferase